MEAGRVFRRPDQIAKSDNIPSELGCLAGPMGPYIASDRAEFYHAHREAQEWFIRMDPEELADLRYSVRWARKRREVIRWVNRILWAAIGAFTAVMTAGEKLAKLPETISGAWSAIAQLFTVARGYFGL